MKSTDSVIVSWDFSHGKDVGVLIVGKQSIQLHILKLVENTFILKK